MKFPPTTTKPPLPYIKGWRFTVRPHIAPPSTPLIDGCCRITEDRKEERRELTLIERCARHPPLAGGFGEGSLDLNILEAIRVEDGYNSQAFIVETESDLVGIKRGKKLVAKVYDPLYVDDDGYIDPFHMVDEHYTHEVRGYRELADFQGGLIPQFYGSSSLDVPVDGSQTRTVRLILIEHIPGLTMDDCNPEDFPQEARQLIIKTVVDFESTVYERDIFLIDQSPRSVIIAEPPQKELLVFVSFGHAVFGRVSDDVAYLRPEFFPGQYISPLLRWDGTMTDDFRKWIDWKWKPWIEAEFAHTIPLITPDMRKRYCVFNGESSLIFCDP
ncbi:hypothetical protein TRVA0_007S02454 [Trichomonascus vanleenenianus]|uniref:uncharacterized protein n=1 Tax=Trichomonascus vanleenenianus TaxID=2268995 RepID=UPI003ECB6B5D